MFSFIKDLFVPKQPDPEMEAAKHLHEARMDLLKAHKEREYWAAMEVMLQERVSRLTTHAASTSVGREWPNIE